MAFLSRIFLALFMGCLAGAATAQITNERVEGMVLWVYDDGSFYVADVSELPLGEAATQGQRVHQFLWHGVSWGAVRDLLAGSLVSCDIVHQIPDIDYISVDCSVSAPSRIPAVLEICNAQPDAKCFEPFTVMAWAISNFDLNCSEIDYENRHNFNDGIFGIPLDRNDPNHQYDRICEKSWIG